MRVLQFARRSVLALAAGAAVLAGCNGGSDPIVPFNPTGASADMAAAGSTFESPTFSSFASLSVFFDAALGGAPLVSSSAGALDLRRTTRTPQGEAARTAERIRRLLPVSSSGSFSVANAAIPAEFVGKTFVYSGGTYVVSDLTGAPSIGVRFLLYAIDPATGLPLEPLEETGHVDLIDLSSGTIGAARIIVSSQATTYLDYRVSVTSTLTSGQVTVFGSVNNSAGVAATFNLRATLTSTAGLTLVYALDIPPRDLSIDLTLTSSGTTTETSTIGLTMDMRGQNGWVRLIGQFVSTGGTLDVLVNGAKFATISETVGSETVITGADGQPLAPEELEALQRIFLFTGGAFLVFDQLLTPAGRFISGTS
jgi:hypothetical protein